MGIGFTEESAEVRVEQRTRPSSSPSNFLFSLKIRRSLSESLRSLSRSCELCRYLSMSRFEYDFNKAPPVTIRGNEESSFVFGSCVVELFCVHGGVKGFALVGS